MPIKESLQNCLLAFGCEALGGTDWGDVDIDAIMKAIARSWELGVRVYDTAAIYGLGLSEERLSKALGTLRHEATIVTKGGLFTNGTDASGRSKVTLDLSRSALANGLEESLKRLKIEAIPVYLVHRSHPQTNIDDLLESLEGFKSQGKIRQFGFSNFSTEQWDEILGKTNGESLVAQFSYSLIDRNPEDSLLPLLSKHRVTTMAYGCLAQGLLSGKYSPSHAFDKNDRRHRLPHFQNAASYQDILGGIHSLAQKENISVGQAAIRWVARQSGIDCVVVGAKNSSQLEQNLIATDFNQKQSSTIFKTPNE